MKTEIKVTLSGMNSSIGTLNIVLPQRSVRRHRHLTQQHREAISRGKLAAKARVEAYTLIIEHATAIQNLLHTTSASEVLVTRFTTSIG
jgi:hypothetical protein